MKNSKKLVRPEQSEWGRSGKVSKRGWQEQIRASKSTAGTGFCVSVAGSHWKLLTAGATWSLLFGGSGGRSLGNNREAGRPVDMAGVAMIVVGCWERKLQGHWEGQTQRIN